jgi:hypothetical protein
VKTTSGPGSSHSGPADSAGLELTPSAGVLWKLLEAYAFPNAKRARG